VSRSAAPLGEDEIRRRIDAVPHWYHRIEVRPGVVTPGINDSAEVLRHLELPDRCDGLRALDIGVRDGFFSFELERRGAEVVAIDYLDASETGFPVAKELLGSGVEYRVDNVYRLGPADHGEFDIVLFLGVLYHLRDPILALDRIWDVCREGALVVVETQLLDQAFLDPDGSFRALDPALADACLAQFYPGKTLRGDATNYWAPSLSCLRGLLETAGFDVERAAVLGARGIVHARKVVDSERLFYRQLEKGAHAHEAARKSTAGGAPTRPAAQSEAVKRLEHDLAAVRNDKAALETQLAGMRRELAEARGMLEKMAGAQEGGTRRTPLRERGGRAARAARAAARRLLRR